MVSPLLLSDEHQQGRLHVTERLAGQAVGQLATAHGDADVRSRRHSSAFLAGYRAGYRNGQSTVYGNNVACGNNNVYRNGNYGNNGYGNDGVNGNPAAQIGFQDGLNDGQAARARGQGMVYGPGYNHPDRGYNNAYGDKNLYKQQYRQAYQQGFQQGYNGGGRGRSGYFGR